MMQLAYAFTTEESTDLSQVGGKAMCLILMTRQGLPVPPGLVLTVAFFRPWLDQVIETAEWTRVLSSLPDDLEQNCEAVKALCPGLELDEGRKAALTQALDALGSDGRSRLFAVRSSSPEEDLEELSFAGGYETVLGVKEQDLEGAIRRAFASAFDSRVFLYKREHGLATDQPSIAVIVQQQIAAETAGVAFSLNPINNCYDEAIVNANFGLGESVVAGLISPDSWVVNRVSRTILDRKLGVKETSVWLAPDGGTYHKPAPARDQFCLPDEKVLALIDMLVRVEKQFKQPIDVEWAFANGNLHLLQSRPITAYFALPEAMVTQPGAPKLLYGDVTLLKWGMPEPLSAMGSAYLDLANRATLKMTMGQDTGPEVINSMRFAVEGRVYVNASHSIRLQGLKRAVALFREMDGVSAEILANIDEEEYVPKKLPQPLKGIVFKMLRQNVGMFWHGLRALRNPEAYERRFLCDLRQLEQDLAALGREQETSMRAFVERMFDTMAAHLQTFFAIVLAAQIAKGRMRSVFKGEDPGTRDQLIYLERALPHNITIEMGLRMYQLAQFDELQALASEEEFAAKLEARALSPQVLEAWDAFMDRFGFRSPMEMDPAAPRFYERPAQFFKQLRTLAQGTEQYSPVAIFEQARARREQAYRDLLDVARGKGKSKARRLEKNYRIWLQLAGYRETPKYYVALITAMFRTRVLQAAQTLVEAGRLDSVEQVFDTSIDELDLGLADPSLDLRSLAAENARRLSKYQHIREFPRLVDSRGKILRGPRREAKAGELAGEPISPGVVRGPVKVLAEPDEKPVLPGDILVTRATDPGWTPLFINASGVVLEVGGMLQHGALVAREYGKPCVSGIEGATMALRDGQRVELDGTNGLVRILAA